MMVVSSALAIGLLLGLVCGGSVRNLGGVRLRFEWVVIPLFVVQALARGRLAGASASSLGVSIWLVGTLVLLAFLAPDWRQPGVWVSGVGMALNMLVVLANGGMPVVPPGQVPASQAAASLAQSAGFYHLAGPGTILVTLGDVLPLGMGATTTLLSAGDVLLTLGVAIYILRSMTGSSREAIQPATL